MEAKLHQGQGDPVFPRRHGPSQRHRPPSGTYLRVTDIPSFNPSIPSLGRHRLRQRPHSGAVPDAGQKGKVAARKSGRQRHFQDPRDKSGRTEDGRQKGQKRSKPGLLQSTDSKRKNPHRPPNWGYAESALSSVESAPLIGFLPYASATCVSLRL